MEMCVSTNFHKSGFTLIEAVVAMMIAAAGLGMIYQSLGGAARLQAGAMEMARTQTVATSIMANAKQAPAGSSSSGIEDGIAWTMQTEVVARGENGQQLVRLRVLASGPSGRQVQMVSETIQVSP
jgi:prepilin-type N-terminal cleavage/methylation domain-containing protein